MKVCGSQQLAAFSLPLPCALQWEIEQIPASAPAPIVRHRTGWAELVAVGHG